MVKRTLPNMAIPTWESQQAKQMRGKLVGIVEITHSVKTYVCTTSPWAQGPVCNVIANAAWLPEFVSGVGGQGVHPIKGGLGVMERVHSQAKAAQVCNTQGCQLHPKTSDVETRKRRKSQDMNTHKATRRVESDKPWRTELGERGGGGTQAGEMDVAAAQEVRRRSGRAA